MASLLDWAQLSMLEEHLIAASIKGILVLLTAAALRFALRRASAAARHLVWSLALTGLLALPVLSFGLPVWQIALLPSAPHESFSIPADFPASKLTLSPAARDLMINGDERASSSVEPATFDSKADLSPRQVSTMTPAPTGWIRWAFLLWVAGALLIVGRLMIGTVSIWWIAHRASRITDHAWINAANDISWQIGLMRPVRMFSTPKITMPVTCGVLSSSILLPADADDWPDERRRVVLVHELAHVKRWDCLTQMLAQMACSIYWFNPLVWLAARQLRIERERACDDQVVEVGTKASDYASHLLDMARTFRSAKCSSLSAVAIARRSELEGRLLAILDPGLRRQGLNRIVAIAVGVVVVCVVLPLATIRLSAKAQTTRLSQGESASVSSIEPADLGSIRHELPGVQSGQRPEEIAQAASGESVLQSEQAQEDQDGAASTGAAQQKDNTAVIEALREALKDEDSEVRQHALFALSQIGDQQALAALAEALKDQSWQVRARAAHGLGLRGGPGGIEALVGALRDTDWQVREQAAWGLGLKGDARAIDPLIDALKDENPQVREKAAWALGLKGGKRSVEGLMLALRDTSISVRAMSAWALGLKGDPRSSNALKGALKDPDQTVRRKAAWALGMLLLKLGGEPIGLPDPDIDVDTETEPDREGRVQGGVTGGIPGGVSGGVSGGVVGGISGGVAAGVASGVSAGVGAGVGIGVDGGISGGVGGGVRTGTERKIMIPNSTSKIKSKPKQK